MTDYVSLEASKTHDLKTWPEPFELIITGRKLFEIRRNDRNYEVGDLLKLREFYPGQNKYSGRHVTARVLSIIEGYGLMPGFVGMGIELVYGSLIGNPCADAHSRFVRDYMEAIRRNTGAPRVALALVEKEFTLRLFENGKPEFGAQLTEPGLRSIIQNRTAFVLKQAKRHFLGQADSDS